jgi:hypothetical protein
MPAPPLSNTLEGGSDGTAVTVGNSGGASGNAFSWQQAVNWLVEQPTAQRLDTSTRGARPLPA